MIEETTIPPTDIRRDWIPVDSEGRLQKEFWCTRCDYDLMGSKVCGTCPQCGTPVASALAGEPVGHTDEAGTILEHLPCATCKQDLFGLSAASECSDCGSPCQFSLAVGMLRYGDPKWLRTVRDGFLWFIIALFIIILLNAGAGIIGAVIKDPAVSAAITSVVGFLGAVMTLITVWFITSPGEQTEHLKAINITRFLAGMMIFAAALSAVSVVAPGYAFWAVLPAILIQGAFNIAFYSFLKTLALRIPDDKLVKHTRIVLWGLTISFFFMFFGVALMAFSGVSPAALQSAGGQAAQLQGTTMLLVGIGGVISGCLGSVPLLIFSIWGIVLLFWFRARFARAAQFAALSSLEATILPKIH